MKYITLEHVYLKKGWRKVGPVSDINKVVGVSVIPLFYNIIIINSMIIAWFLPCFVYGCVIQFFMAIINI